MNWSEIDWPGLFVPGISMLESTLRCTVVYFVLIALFRILPRRTTGDVGMMDLLLVVLIAEAANSAMASDSMSLIDGVILVITLVGWNYVINKLTFAIPVLERLISQPPLPINENGRLLRRNMSTEQITIEELEHRLRRNGIADVKSVNTATVESDGHITFVER
jgi:uncharacterized membrane protein YcaP (DUF421 family)